MFNIGPMELLVIALVGIIFIGPDKLPEVLKKFGRMFVTVKRHANEVKGGFDQVMQDAERELELERIRELQKKLEAFSPAQVIDTMIEDKSVKPDDRLTAQATPHALPAASPALPEGEYESFHKDAHPHQPRPADQLAARDSDPFSQDRLEEGLRDLRGPDAGSTGATDSRDSLKPAPKPS